MKRGAEKELVTHVPSELYAPKVDSTDSYSASYTTNYPRDPYYTNYNPYNKLSHPSSYAYHSTVPYSYPTPAYTAYNSYSSPSYIVSPPSYAGIPYSSYPSHYYQPPYYYPSYYNQPPPLAAPPLPSAAPDYPAGPYSDSESSEKFKEKNPDGDNNYRDNDVNQFVDGANHISENSRDLDGQSSSYKSTGLRNQLERSGDQRMKNLPIPLPKTTYRVISVAGQPVGPDYPLPAPYAKAQQLEELMSRAWARLLAQDLQQAAQYPLQEATSNQNDQSKDKARAISVPSIAKTGLAYIVNPSVLRKFNAAPTVDQDLRIPTTTTQLKSVKYPHSTQPVYAIETEGKDQAEPNEYENYEHSSTQGSQDYDSPTFGQVEKQRQNYEDDQGQAVSYRHQNYASAHGSPGHSYRYTNYNPQQPTVQQQPQQYKNNLEDVDFGAKTKAG